MDYQPLFYVSMSIQAIVVTVFLLVVIYFVAKLMRSIAEINKKILEVAEESAEAAEEAKLYIGKIGKSIVDYFVVKIIGSVKGKK